MGRIFDALIEASSAYIRLREELEDEIRRAEYWKGVALEMRAHTNVVGVRILKQAIEEDMKR